jgi:hypothetical protein
MNAKRFSLCLDANAAQWIAPKCRPIRLPARAIGEAQARLLVPRTPEIAF